MIDAIATQLQTKSIGTVGTNIILGFMPEEPDECVAIFEYAGEPPDLHWNGSYPGLQVRARANDYATVRTTMDLIYSALHGTCEETWSNIRFLLIQALGSPEVLKRDNKDRIEMFINFRVIREG